MKNQKWMETHVNQGFLVKISGLCLLLFIVLITARCAKDRLVGETNESRTLTVNSPDLQQRLQHIRKAYDEQQLQQKLQPDQADKLSWVPDWDHPEMQVVHDSVSYIFYPMLGKVTVNGKAEVGKQINGKLYLMVKNEKEFYKAFYFDPNVDPNEKISGNTKEFNVKTFTGKLLLSSLQHKGNYLLDYVNGHLSDTYQAKGRLAARKMQAVEGAISQWQKNCQYEQLNCTFSSLSPSYCGGDVDIVFSRNCNWPQTTCGVTYSLIDSDQTLVCEDIWYPDAPESPGQGGDGGTAPVGPTPTEFNQNIDLAELSPCASSILHSLMYQTEGSVVMMIQKFAGEIPGYSWKVKTGTLPDNVNGGTNRVSGGATTTIDVNKYSNGRDLALARTLLHEAVHAYLVSYFGNNQDLFRLSYPELLLEYEKQKKKSLNDAHHIEMTIEFKNDIAKGLQEYGDMHGYTFSSSAEKQQFYSDMAWGGLEATPAYKKLSTADKNRIQDTLQAEQYGTDRNGDYKAGKGNPSGC